MKRLADTILSERENGMSKPVLSTFESKQAKAAPVQLPVVKKKRKLPKDEEECNDNSVAALSSENVQVQANPAIDSKPNVVNVKKGDGDDGLGGGLGGLLSYASSEDD